MLTCVMKLQELNMICYMCCSSWTGRNLYGHTIVMTMVLVVLGSEGFNGIYTHTHTARTNLASDPPQHVLGADYHASGLI